MFNKHSAFIYSVLLFMHTSWTFWLIHRIFVLIFNIKLIMIKKNKLLQTRSIRATLITFSTFNFINLYEWNLMYEKSFFSFLNLLRDYELVEFRFFSLVNYLIIDFCVLRWKRNMNDLTMKFLQLNKRFKNYRLF